MLEDSKCGWHEDVIMDVLMLVTWDNKEREGGRQCTAYGWRWLNTGEGLKQAQNDTFTPQVRIQGGGPGPPWP